jgi:hypothetical protein
MKLHVLTAITRLHNVPRIAESLTAAAGYVDLVWHWRFDIERQKVGGQELKNDMIDGITDGWIWILDDDNLMHPLFCKTLIQTLTAHPDALMIVVGQVPLGGYIRQAAHQNLRVDHVDAAQMIIRRDALGAHRLPLTYAGDGLLAETLAKALPTDQIICIPDVVSYYNRLAS